MPSAMPEVFLIPLFSAVLAILLSTCVNFYFQFTNAKNDIIKDYISELDKIENLSIKYWLGDHSGTTDLLAVGVELRARLDSTIYFRTQAKNKKIILTSYYSDFIELDGKLFDIATGGAFQTSSMQCDAAVADQIIQTISEIRSILRESRMARYWIH